MKTATLERRLPFQGTKTFDIGQHSLAEVTRRYGSGIPLREDGAIQTLLFHNRRHTLAVAAGTKLMVRVLDGTEAEAEVGEKAALAHDVKQLGGRGKNERESAEWFGKLARRWTTYSEKLITAGEVAIEHTELTFIDGRPVQRASLQEYATAQEARMSLGMSCGDMSELYSPAGPLLGHYHCKELAGASWNDPVPWETVVEAQTEQASFVSTYEFPHSMGEAFFGHLRGAVIDYTVQLETDMLAGTIETMEQVINRDVAFMRSHS